MVDDTLAILPLQAAPEAIESIVVADWAVQDQPSAGCAG